MISISVGVPAHNEAGNIGLLLRALSKQRLESGFSFKEIVVVASGCTDGTQRVVERSREFDRRIRLIVEEERRGKASAVNIILRECDSDVLVMEPADTIPRDKSLQNLVSRFNDKSVGAAGGRPIPVNPENTVMGWIPHVIWGLHHYMAEAEDNEKKYFHISGEFCAIRTGIVERIPENIVNDDAYIGLQIMRAGYRVVYVPEATVNMRGPSSIQDIVSQRRRVVYGHMQLENTQDADIASIKPRQIIMILPKILKLQPKKLIGTIIGIGFEAVSHVLAERDVRKGRLHRKWRMATSTKSLTAYGKPAMKTYENKDM